MKLTLPTKADLIIAVILAILLITLGKSCNFNENQKAGGKEYFKPNLYKINKGRITAKYIDKENHANKTIELIINDSLEYYYTLDQKKGRILFEYIQVSDSIIKMNFGKNVTIRRNGYDSVFILD